jgi:hypothetical protein
MREGNATILAGTAQNLTRSALRSARHHNLRPPSPPGRGAGGEGPRHAVTVPLNFNAPCESQPLALTVRLSFSRQKLAQEPSVAQEEANPNLPNGDQPPRTTLFAMAVNLLLNHGAILATLTIVLGIGSGIAAVTLIPRIQQAREQERRELTKKNLKAIGEAMHRHQQQQAQASAQEPPQPAHDQPPGPTVP